MMLRVAALQMSSGPEVGANLRTVERLLERAVDNDVRLVVLPENFSLMPRRDSDRLGAAETAGQGPVQAFVSEQAARHDLWIVAGTIPIVSHDIHRVRAASLVYDNHGRQAARYDKIHLFDVAVSDQEAYRESDYIEPGPVQGNQIGVETPVGRWGLTVCYDVRFPELYRALSRDGVCVFAVPSAFTATTGKAHWEVLLRARAVENLAYVVAAAQFGAHANGRRTYGHSMVIGPWGEVIDEVEEQEGMAVADVDIEYLKRLRDGFPSLDHRRL
jgi:nitrilase